MLKICKILIFIAIFGLVGADEIEITVSKVIEMMQPYSAHCEPKPEREHYIELIRNKPDAQYTSKCLRHCLMERFESFIPDENKFHAENVGTMLSLVFTDRDAELQELAEKCNNQHGGMPDKCEAAHHLGLCMFEEMKGNGFEIPEVPEE